jgi:fructose-1,6-bisphosphatase II
MARSRRTTVALEKLMATSEYLDRNLAFELARVTESAALAGARWQGKGDKNGADGAAVKAMRLMLATVDMDGIVVIGEGEKDEAPMLYIGEEIGNGMPPRVDIAVDPIDGTTLTSKGLPNAVSVVALAERGTMYYPPGIVYMEKLAVGPAGKGHVSLEQTPTENIKSLAKALKVDTTDLTVVVLDRPRHLRLIEALRGAGARIKLITDGDVSAALATTKADTGIDLMMGIGRAPQGILAAAALKCLDGEMQARLKPRNETEAQQLREMGVFDFGRKYPLDALVPGNVIVAATGVTPGDYLAGVRYRKGGAITASVVMRSQTKTVRFMEAYHTFDRKPQWS